MNAPVPAWATAWMESSGDPLRFATGVLGIPMPGEPSIGDVDPLEAWQVKMFSAIRDGHSRLSIRSGHGVRKSSSLAILVLWGLLCHGPGVKIPVVAGTQKQLRDTIFPEIKRWGNQLPPPLYAQLDFQTERVTVKAAPEEAFAVARTASRDNPQAMAGFHARKLILIVDEASAVDEEAYEVGQGALSTPGAIAILAGNPSKANGYFHATHTTLRERWWTLRVSSQEVVSARGHIEDIRLTYGEGSNAWRVRVEGEFPTKSDETVIPLELVEPARTRDVATTMFQPVWGVDIARHGDDRCAIAKRRGNTLLEPVMWWGGVDLTVSAGKIRREWEDCPLDDRPSEILIDSIGLGAGVLDMLREQGLPVRGVNVAETPSANDQYARLRDELWFKGREWFHGRDVKIAPDGALIAELTAPTYDFTSTGKIVVEPKKEMKKRGLRSPDLADAFLLTFAGGLDRPVERKRRFRDEISASAWAA